MIVAKMRKDVMLESYFEFLRLPQWKFFDIV